MEVYEEENWGIETIYIEKFYLPEQLKKALEDKKILKVGIDLKNDLRILNTGGMVH